MLSTTLWALTAAIYSVSAAKQTPLLSYTDSSSCISHALHISLPGLQSSDFSLFPSTSLLKQRFDASTQDQRLFSPLSSNVEAALNKYTPCTGMSNEGIALSGLEGMSNRKERKEKVQALHEVIEQTLAQLPADHLVVISALPLPAGPLPRLGKRQEPIEDTDLPFNEHIEVGSGAAPDYVEEAAEAIENEFTVTDPVETVEEEDFPWSDLATELEEEIDALPSAIQQQQEPSSSSSTRPSSSGTPNPAYLAYDKNAPYIARYSIVSPMLIFASLLFVLVLFPAAFLGISALGSIQMPVGLETKMNGGTGGEKKDQ